MSAIRTSILALLLCAFMPSAEAKESIRILFIGNSYTGQIKKSFAGLIQASPYGASTEIEFITPGGKNLQFHLHNESTTRKITEGNWDFVVLQDQSQTPAVFPERFEAAAIELDKLIDSAGAKTVLYQTWGRRDGDKQNAERFPTYESMQTALSESYIKAAESCDAILAPVGDAWAKIRQASPGLGKELYKDDGSHPSDSGAYLAACVFYAVMLGQSPDLLDFSGGVSDRDAALIQQAAREAVGRRKQHAN